MVTTCLTCEGRGTVVRPPDAQHPMMDGFPKLCDRCSGSGVVKAALPVTEGQAPVASP